MGEEKKELFNINGVVDPKKCSAKRCKGENEGFADGAHWGLDKMTIPLCDRHLKLTPYDMYTLGGPLAQGAALVVPEGTEIDTSELDTGTAIIAEGDENAALSALATLPSEEGDPLSEQIEIAKSVEIETQEDLDDVQEWLVAVKGEIVSLLEIKDRFVKPLYQRTQKMRDVFRPYEDELGELEEVLKGRLAETQKKLNADNQKALDEVAEDTANGKKSNGVSKIKNFGGVKGVSMSLKWKWRLTGDIEDVDDEYLQLAVNDRALNALCKGAKEKPAAVEGIEFYEDVGVRASA